MQRRREFLKATSAAIATATIAGCSGASDGADATETTDPAETTAANTATETGGENGDAAVSADAAVAAQWNVYRARLADAAALGIRGEFDAGARIASNAFSDFETAGGEYGAHEKLEVTSDTHYEGFERGVADLRSALSEGDSAGARDALRTAEEQLRGAQRSLVGEQTANALDVLAFADRAATARAFASAAKPEAAAVVANAALTAFESAPAHDALEAASGEAYETFETELGNVLDAGQRGNVEDASAAADAALTAAVDGAYAVGSEAAGHVGQVASVQSRAYDAAMLAALGGPAPAFSHAATLTTYRARVHDAAWLADAGATEAAATAAIDVLKHFEGAKAHEPLEQADEEAYDGFEGGVTELQSAIESGGDVSGALSKVDANLVAGVDALATGTEGAVLQAGFLRARLADAREHYRRGRAERGATVAEAVFERFETDELGLHEALESTSEALYETFEHEHLGALAGAMRDGNDDAVAAHADGAMQALLDFETRATTTARVSGAEAAYLDGRAFDAAALADAGARERAATVAGDAMAHFEGGAGGFHEALESASEDTYHAFEERLVGVRSAASGDGDAYAAAKAFNAEAVTATYEVAAAAGGDLSASAAGVVRSAYEDFETARAHEPLENASKDAYEAFEESLGSYASGLESGNADVSAVARASVRAEFALAGAVEKAPVGEAASGGSETELSGGPNVVDGVPADADHVVDMKALAYSPTELTVSTGDKVAWKHAEGEAHSVTAYEDELPDGAAYWASGGFDSQSAAADGWKNGNGAVQSGQSYVHTFETVGEHAYYCIPHESLGMKGTVVVEE